MKQQAKRLLGKILPNSYYATLMAVRARSFIQKQEQLLGLSRINRSYEQTWGRTVRNGPFAGMTYTEMTTDRHICQRLIGCYEEELHDIVRSWHEKNYSHIYDIGCAEGYYAVGLARMLESAHITAFDTDPWARKACQALAQKNNVESRVSVEGYCDNHRLVKCKRENSLFILDCEGFEDVLLGDHAVGPLARADILVEIHTGAPTTEHPIAKRFANSHHLEIIISQTRDASHYPEVENFDSDDARLAISDMRNEGQGWFWLSSKSSS